MENILDQLGNKKIDADEIIIMVKKDYSILPDIIQGISSSNARIKFGCAKVLCKISEDDPEKLYPEIDFFINLLKTDNNIIKWNVMDVLANLARVDTEKKFDEIFNEYYGLLSDDGMVTVGHVIDNSGKIALAKPYLIDKITNELLKIEKISVKPRLTQECKNILMGKAILAFDKYYDQLENKKKVVSFIQRQLNNPRMSTKIKAKKFLEKI
jgi:hypothetical protein